MVRKDTAAEDMGVQVGALLAHTGAPLEPQGLVSRRAGRNLSFFILSFTLTPGVPRLLKLIRLASVGVGLLVIYSRLCRRSNPSNQSHKQQTCVLETDVLDNINLLR